LWGKSPIRLNTGADARFIPEAARHAVELKYVNRKKGGATNLKNGVEPPENVSPMFTQAAFRETIHPDC
jgi:hypothetical protein